MTWARCSSCGEMFEREADEEWKRLCLDCWRTQKADQRRTRHGVGCARCYALGKAEGAAQASPALDKTRLRELLQLAHPDRHDGSALAQRVTRWLIEQREALP